MVKADWVNSTLVALSNEASRSSSSLSLSMAGVKNADLNELQEIASEPDSTHVYNVAEFDLMHTVVESLTRTVCSRVEEQDKEIKGKELREGLWTWAAQGAQVCHRLHRSLSTNLYLSLCMQPYHCGH